jgi:cyclohexa-1,5-dienecarbonyl-CoA hydratase
MAYQSIAFQIRDGVAYLMLNKPPLNVLDIAMMREINHALETVAAERTLRALVFDAAEGSKAFSAGVDVTEHTAEQVHEMITVFHGIFQQMDLLECPTLALVNGAALGGGCELAMQCDVIIASENASFGQPEIQVGVFPPVAMVVLPEIIGPKKAMELLLTGERIRAEQAEGLGLVNKVVPADELRSSGEAFVTQLRQLSAAVLRLTKRAMRAGQARNFPERLAAVEELYLGDLMATEDAHEGLAAFIEKRSPVWKDR